MPGQTPSQTVGPYFSMVLAHDDDGEVLVTDATAGQRVVLTGRLLDGDGAPVEDGLLELWQADADGRYRHPRDRWEDGPGADGFTGFGRSKTTFEGGTWRFLTVVPGRVALPDGTPQAAHWNLLVQARGMLGPLFTRVYLDEHAGLHEEDPVLAAVPADRRHTLVAVRDGEEDGVPVHRLDLRLQGDDETVFLDF